MDQSFDTSVVVFKGTDAVSNFTIGTVESKNGNMFYEFTANNKTDTKVKSINILNIYY